VQHFAFKLQQFTGPMMAKSLEDTAFYRYVRLAALNEVGGDPAAPGLTIATFHERLVARAAKAPHGMTATATHDTKRGEDARARVLAISELPADWASQARAWCALNAHLAQGDGDSRAPSLGHEYMLYQTLVGAWPLAGVDESFVERMQAYAIKAAREGKVETSWINPNQDYEAALHRFVAAMLDRGQSEGFLASFDAFARRLALLGALNSLSQLVLKATMPGIPDFYQGSEFWDLSLVDPDNRRPVDFAARRATLQDLDENVDWRALADAWPDARIKLALTRRLLAVRTELRSVFTDGAYRPLPVEGAHRDHVLAFARVSGREAAIVVVGRHFAHFTDDGRRWPEASQWDAEVLLDGFTTPRDRLQANGRVAGQRLAANALFDAMPVALLQATPVRQASAAKQRANVGA
jgi:(1->4)-alpha-D-glucan 1-alpha-D-glucosylmutase